MVGHVFDLLSRQLGFGDVVDKGDVVRGRLIAVMHARKEASDVEMRTVLARPAHVALPMPVVGKIVEKVNKKRLAMVVAGEKWELLAKGFLRAIAAGFAKGLIARSDAMVLVEDKDAFAGVFINAIGELKALCSEHVG